MSTVLGGGTARFARGVSFGFMSWRWGSHWVMVIKRHRLAGYSTWLRRKLEMKDVAMN
jgi:hypothetical protein